MIKEVCINIGSVNDDGQKFLLPFHVIDGVYVQYTFGSACAKQGIKFENQLGEVKLRLFQSFTDSVMVNPIESTDKEFIKRIMVKRLQTAKDKNMTCILFVIKRLPHDDSPFFEAFNITGETSKPVFAEDLKLNVKSPFLLVPKEEVGMGETRTVH